MKKLKHKHFPTGDDTPHPLTKISLIGQIRMLVRCVQGKNHRINYCEPEKMNGGGRGGGGGEEVEKKGLFITSTLLCYIS